MALRDGSRVLIRPVQPADKALFAESWEHFGEESRYRRFLGAKGDLSARDLAYFTEVDHVDHEAIGARDAESGAGVGVARYVRLAEQPAVAEAAVSVVDAWQGRGLGGELLRRLTGRAREHGVERFQASLFAFNHSMLALFEEVGEVQVHERGMGQIEIDVELPCDRERGLADALPGGGQGPRPAAAVSEPPHIGPEGPAFGRRGFLLAAAALAVGAPEAAAQPARDWAIPARAAPAAPARARCATSRGGCAGPFSATTAASTTSATPACVLTPSCTRSTATTSRP